MDNEEDALEKLHSLAYHGILRPIPIILPEGFSIPKFNPVKSIQSEFNRIIVAKTLNECDCQYVNVGFHHDKWVCKICNKEKT